MQRATVITIGHPWVDVPIKLPVRYQVPENYECPQDIGLGSAYVDRVDLVTVGSAEFAEYLRECVAIQDPPPQHAVRDTQPWGDIP